jgi:hypothetical protein
LITGATGAPDAIINELTVLPKHSTPEAMRATAELNRKVRVEGNANLLAGAHGAGVRRYILQSAAFWVRSRAGVADEATSFAFDALPGLATGTGTYAELEAKALGSPKSGKCRSCLEVSFQSRKLEWLGKPSV